MMLYKSEIQDNNVDLQEILAAVNALPNASGGGITPSGTKQIVENGTYDVTNYATAEVNVPQPEMPETVAQATPEITVSSSGKITATSTQTAGYVEGGTKTATKQLTTKGATTVTPSSVVQTVVSAGTFVTGDIKVAAVSGGGNSGGGSQEKGLVERNITNYSNEDVTSIGDFAFTSCYSLASVNCPNVTTIGYEAFWSCDQLETVYIPAVTNIESLAFEGCSLLTRLDLSSATQIKPYAFADSGLATLILRSTSMCSIPASTALGRTPIASGEGYIYVPSGLVSSYKNNANWSAYKDQIRAIEDYL